MTDVLIERAKRIAQMPISLNRDDTLDVFRDAVLKAMDEAARETFNPPRNDAGASDADLPRLFKALDEHVNILAERYGVALIDQR